MDRTWRLIVDGDQPSAMNMAIDEAILLSFLRGETPPTLRLYGWKQPSITVGCFQNLDSGRMSLEYCKEQGINVVRRSTGGRAVVHGNDLTFSIVVGMDDLPPDCRGVVPSHAYLMQGIVNGLRTLDIPADIGPERHNSHEKSVGADCFAHIAECDVRLGRAKIAGAAQVRRGNGLMEQGSLPYRESSVDFSQLFPGTRHIPTPLPDTLLQTKLPHLQTAIIDGFTTALGVRFTGETLTTHELAEAHSLAETRYENNEWTYAHR